MRMNGAAGEKGNCSNAPGIVIALFIRFLYSISVNFDPIRYGFGTRKIISGRLVNILRYWNILL